jgi:hypothetical protein
LQVYKNIAHFKVCKPCKLFALITIEYSHSDNIYVDSRSRLSEAYYLSHIIEQSLDPYILHENNSQTNFFREKKTPGEDNNKHTV